MTEQEDAMVQCCKRNFGRHGGVGDPPPDIVIRAIIRGVHDYAAWAVGQESQEETH